MEKRVFLCQRIPSPPLLSSRLPFASLLPEKNFELKMRFTKGDVGAFFDSRTTPADLLSERTRLLENDGDRYWALASEGEELLEETIQLAGDLDTISPFDFSPLSPREKCRALGRLWEADYLLMKPDLQGVFRLYGGCVCFPSHWDLGSKMNRPMASIHGPVPGLNDALGRQIDGFLGKIKPGISWERGNWGLCRSPDRNLHPHLDFPRLDETVTLDEVWWRLEEQSLVSLPKSGGILFGIKLVIRPLSELKAHREARLGLVSAIETMSDEMAAYKGILPARERLLALLST